MKQLKISPSITDRQSLSFDRYLQEIGRIKLLSAEEEVALTRRIKQ
jgi:RNA polymerase primary sigma factor